MNSGKLRGQRSELPFAYAIMTVALGCASGCQSDRAQDKSAGAGTAAIGIQPGSQRTATQVVESIGRAPDEELQATDGRRVLIWQFTKDLPELGPKRSAFVATIDEFGYQLRGIHLVENQSASILSWPEVMELLDASSQPGRRLELVERLVGD